MKTIVLALVMLSSAVGAWGQGFVYFQNLWGTTLNAPVYESDGVTKLNGSRFVAELLGGPNGTSLSSIATTGFLQGAIAGYFNAGLQSIPTVGPGDFASLQVRVWNTATGSSFAAAQASGLADAYGSSVVFRVQTGGPDIIPPALIGLNSFSLNTVPEPSALTLIALGSLLLFFRISQVLTRPCPQISDASRLLCGQQAVSATRL